MYPLWGLTELLILPMAKYQCVKSNGFAYFGRKFSRFAIRSLYRSEGAVNRIQPMIDFLQTRAYNKSPFKKVKGHNFYGRMGYSTQGDP